MPKIRMTIEIEVLPYTEEQLLEESKLCGIPVDELRGDDVDVDAFHVAECIASYLSNGCDEALAGSNIMIKLGEAELIDSSLINSK